MGSFFCFLIPENLNKRMKIQTNYFFARENNKKNILTLSFTFIFVIRNNSTTTFSTQTSHRKVNDQNEIEACEKYLVLIGWRLKSHFPTNRTNSTSISFLLQQFLFKGNLLIVSNFCPGFSHNCS